MTPEGRLQKKIVDYAKSLGFLVKRNHMARGAARGWPDLEIFALRGVVLLVEVKAPGEKPSLLQMHRIEELRALGHVAFFVDNFEIAKAILNAYRA